MIWHQLGRREKQTPAILRLHEDPLTTREVLDSLQADGADLAYTAVNTVLDCLIEKAAVTRTAEIHTGSHPYRYAFDAIVELVLGSHRLDRQSVRATEEPQ